uniref:Putative secreted protein n=1 Tax=Ixodes ricinus TaxID=34613 RepID=A0A6B0UQ47_IXORI
MLRVHLIIMFLHTVWYESSLPLFTQQPASFLFPNKCRRADPPGRPTNEQKKSGPYIPTDGGSPGKKLGRGLYKKRGHGKSFHRSRNVRESTGGRTDGATSPRRCCPAAVPPAEPAVLPSAGPS